MPAVVFDFDGVIIDSEYEIATCVLDALTARGATIALADIAHLFGSTDLDDEWDALLDRLFHGSFTSAELDAELDVILPDRIDALPLLPGVIEVLDAAKAASWPIGMATGQSRRRLDQHLLRLGLADRFDTIVTRSEVSRGKPAPDIYLAAAMRLEHDPGACLAIEDSLPGCQAALAAGMEVVVCPSRVTADCAFPPAIRRVNSLSDLRLDSAFRPDRAAPRRRLEWQRSPAERIDGV